MEEALERRARDYPVLRGEEERLAEAGRAHLTTAQIGAATSALHLPLWALVSDTRAY